MRRFLFFIFTVLLVSLPFPRAAFAETGLVVSTVERHPFVIKKGEKLTGFSVELWREIARELRLETRFVLHKSFPEMVGQVKSGKSDVAIANISITSGREKQMDFSQPIFDSGLQILVPKSSGSQGIFSVLTVIWNSGLFGLLFMILIVLLVAAHVMYWLETGKEDETFFDERYPQGMFDALWWAFVIITMGGFEDMRPKRRWSVAFAVFWIVTGLIASSIVISKITSALTVQQLTSGISSYRDLGGKKVGVTTGSTAEKFLKENDIRVKGYSDIKKLFRDVRKGKLDAVVHDAPLLQYFAAHGGRGKVMTAGKVFRREKYGIAFPQGSPLNEHVTRILLQLHENGRYEQLRQRWFGDE